MEAFETVLGRVSREEINTSNLSKAHKMRDSLSSYYSQVVLI